MFLVNMDNVLTLSESSDVEMIVMYQRYLSDSEEDRESRSKISRKMGYIATVNEAKISLEKIFKNSNSSSNNSNS